MTLVKVDRSVGKHCLRRDVGIGSRSQKALEKLRMIGDIPASVAGANELRLVGVSRGRVWGDELVAE